MGTSGSFGGSGGKDAQDLRESIAGWLDDDSSTDQAADAQSVDTRNIDRLRPMIRMLANSRGSGSGGGGGSAGGSSGGGGRSSGGVARSVQRTSRVAGRAGSLASAYAAGDRATLAAAGLNYDELIALNDPLEVGSRIAKAALDSQSDGTFESGEERVIVAELIAWIIESPPDSVPRPDEVARKSIELIIAECSLSEVSDTLRSGPMNASERRQVEDEIREAAGVLAGQASLSATGATEAEITQAIRNGIDMLVKIYGGSA
ncbi:hypothetical protein [Nocardia farcinica]|uniref:hypothetical protein n=1 Tax=Nocardia farcinica TaxID=37329 RepID=UPI001894DE00|nr:hypothetical protein [Nocardia farcinica]MBF6271627.1 hypothetical protein [Nocardia farcinica]MCZ9328790.1 hypothetical protein [Nocardia farcinica]